MAQQVTSSIEPQSQEALPISQTAFGGGQGGPSPAPSSGAAPVGDNPQDLYRKILQMAMQASSPRPVLPQPVPRQAQQQQKGGEVPGYMQSGPQWGFERFSHNLQNQILPTIQNAFGQHKQQQIAKAEADWNVLNTGLQTGNQPLIQSILGDPKKLKEMAKALNQDWMNPKNSVYLQGLQQYAKKQDMDNQKKAGLIQKLKQAFAQKQQMQLNPQQQQALTQEMMGKIGKEQQPADMKALLPIALEGMKEESATKKAEEEHKFQETKAEMTQKFAEWKQDTHDQFQQRIQTMREDAMDRRQSEREMMMLKALGIRLSAEDKKQLEPKASDINKEINENLKDMRQQFQQAEGKLKSLRTQLSNHPLYSRLGGMSNADLVSAQQASDNLKKSIAYIEGHRSAIVAGKEDMSKVLDKAQEIASGSPDLSDLGGTK